MLEGEKQCEKKEKEKVEHFKHFKGGLVLVSGRDELPWLIRSLTEKVQFELDLKEVREQVTHSRQRDY